MDNKLYLLRHIETCRKEMIELTLMEGFTSDAVIAASSQLDELLNEYQKILCYK